MKQSKKNLLAQKVRQRKKVILYEFLPPPKDLSKTDLEEAIKFFSKQINQFPVDAVNIPEVREETREGTRKQPKIIKLEPRVVCSILQKYEASSVIVNRPIVYIPWDRQLRWLKETYEDFNIHNFIFVGGESSKIIYPGYSVVQAAEEVTNNLHKEFKNIFLGGITIPIRKNEAERMFQKANAGIEFFTSQILYEAESMKKVLGEYWELCKKHKQEPKMIFLSFAPISTIKDIELLKWLGVDIPKITQDDLTKGWLGMGSRSLTICKEILRDIISFVKKHKIEIPIGLNVEHVSRHNFELSFILLSELSKIYDKS